MKYKVGDEVMIKLPGCNYDGLKTKIRSVDVNSGWYSLSIDSGIYAWSDSDLIDTHEDCGCRELDEPVSAGLDSREKIAEVVKWLYLNDNRFGSARKWKEELVKFLEEIL